MPNMVTHSGGCHCGAVRYKVKSPKSIIAHACNCSICKMSGYVHLIVPKDQFYLNAGEDNLAEYRFNTGVARHFFCKTCGVKSFYVPRSNPDGISVNVNCLDTSTFDNIEIEGFDGQNWEANAASLARLA